MGTRILLVDDEPLILKGIKYSLEQDGYETDIAMDGEEALEKMRAEAFDLILLDLILPKKLGEDVLTEMKMDNNLKNIPVLVTTVKADTESIGRCTVLGIRGYFIKSDYSLEELVEKAKEVLKEK